MCIECDDTGLSALEESAIEVSHLSGGTWLTGATTLITDDAPAIFAPGTTVVTFTARDAAGNVALATTRVTVVDTLPPEVLYLSVTPQTLWPPDHRMVDVEIDAVAVDAADEGAACTLQAIESSEPVDGPGDGATSPDFVFSGALTARLRAERSGGGEGRSYRLEVLCSDASGNSATAVIEVFVEHDQRGD